MRLKVLGSGSKGNCYLLDNGRECLMLECGVDFKEVKKALSFDISRIVGVLVSHEHGDHAGHIKQCLETRIPIFSSKGTLEALKVDSLHKLTHLNAFTNYRIGDFRVLPFPTEHDASEPFGFLIKHPECGLVLFATDTYYLKYTFPDLNNIMIECNYHREILNQNIANGRIPKPMRDRVMQSHMGLETCIKTLQANDLSHVNNIVLIHLSDGNSDEALFKEEIRKATGRNVQIASAGMDVEFNKEPF